jgi:hypothetical protein
MCAVVIETNFAVNYGRKMFVKLATVETARNEFFSKKKFLIFDLIQNYDFSSIVF